MPRSSEVWNSHRTRLGALVAFLTLATASSTYLPGAASALSAYLIHEFTLTPAEYGLIFTVFYVSGGIGSLLVGRIVDAWTQRAMAGLFAASTLGILLVASAPGYAWVLGAALVGGLAVAAANPATNKLVSQTIAAHRHGVVIGIKQSGPPIGLLAAGLILPPLAEVLGWRWALAITALVPLAGFAATWTLVNGRGSRASAPTADAEGRRSGRATVWWLAAIGFMRAVGGASVIAFVPVYAYRELGLSATTAGLTAAVLGFAGVLGRLVWGARASRFREPAGLLTLLAVLAVISSLLIWAASAVTALIWVGVVGAGFSVVAWVAISWLALLHAVESSEIGWTTGVIQFGTSAGMATGPLIMGLLIDTSGGFSLGWAFVVGTFIATLALTLLWRRAVSDGLALSRVRGVG